MGWPVALKQLTLEKTAKTYSAGYIGIELQVRGWGSGRLQRKGTPVLFHQENLPHIEVLEKLPIKPDVMKTTGNTTSQVDSALKEGPARDYHLTRELEGANK